MHRFHLEPDQCRNDMLHLPEREAHHAATVLRLRTGDRLEVLDGQGSILQCRVRESSRTSVTLSVQERVSIPPSPWSAHLFQAVPKGKTMDTIIQKATELGARRIIPLLSNRVNVQLNRDERRAKTARWQATAIEAIKQCAQPWLPTIETPAALNEILARNETFDLSIIAALLPDSCHPRACFDEFQTAHGRPPRNIAIWVGPEGDFAPEEVRQIIAAGARPVTLGPRILRAETAALYCLSVVSYELTADPGSPSARTSPTSSASSPETPAGSPERQNGRRPGPDE